MAGVEHVGVLVDQLPELALVPAVLVVVEGKGILELAHQRLVLEFKLRLRRKVLAVGLGLNQRSLGLVLMVGRFNSRFPHHFKCSLFCILLAWLHVVDIKGAILDSDLSSSILPPIRNFAWCLQIVICADIVCKGLCFE